MVSDMWNTAKNTVGSIAFFVALLLQIVRFLGDLDFVIERANDPGWIGKVLTAITELTPGQTLLFTMMLVIGGFFLIWLKRAKPTPAPQIDQESQNGKAAVGPQSHTEGGPFPDMTIRELFFHIEPSVLDDDGSKPSACERVGRDILDQLSIGRVTAWGREMPEEGSLDEMVFKGTSPQEIGKDYWAKTDFTYLFFTEIGQHVRHTYPPHGSGLPSYSDLQFNRAEVLRIWPEGGATFEWSETQPRAKPSGRPRRDVWVLNALHFIAFGSWKLQDGGLAPGQGLDLIRAMRALEQAALDGDVPIWGKDPLGNKYVLIEPAKWEHIEIREKAVLDADPKRVYARRKHGNVLPSTYNELKTSKAKVLEWRAANTSP